MTLKKAELDLDSGKVLTIETGHMALEASGSVTVRLGDTMILAVATASSKPREGIDFFPLIVDFEEKLYSVGKIPGGFFRREGKPSEKAILNARKIDRPIRPLFPEGYINDVQIVVTPLSVDQENPPDILGIIGASAALSISEIPFEGPIGAARIGKIGRDLIVNPTMSQMRESDMDIVVAGTKDKILMIEAGAKELPEEEILAAIKKGHDFIKKVVSLQEELIAKFGKKKIEVSAVSIDKKIEDFINKNYKEKIEKAIIITDKKEQMNELSLIQEKIKEELEKNDDIKSVLEKKPKDVSKIIENIEYDFMRNMILEKKKRLDGRGLKEIRKVTCEIGVVPRAHGSALFTRGQTQVLTIATLGAAGDAQMIEGLDLEDTEKRYMHHYNFPAFSVGEVRPLRGPGRREIGHGSLAEKALLPVIPSKEKFPYALRLVSEALGSNGSTSMASTCGSTLALMDAGVKISSPVAGISIGLITDNDKWVTITDIQGLEDHLGDMDFKVTGTRKGVTAIQVDIKIKGLTYEILEVALNQAKEGRISILDKIEEAIKVPREELSEYAPRVISFKINPEKIGLVIGPGGKNIRRIIEETGVQVDIEDDGTVLITTSDSEGAKEAKRRIDEMTFEPKEGDVFKSKVVRIMQFGAFVELPGGKDGLVHISQLDKKRVAKVEDVVNVGDEVVVKVMEIDREGRINLTIKGVTSEDNQKVH
ncbi:polyribonucleotide nucleotidyltransferase [candidate division WOR-1 bacterium RIFOXYD2_FULL_36_8]|uniref:Polyribonucleotide nucleotidyltransferase n=1 Tax=candidate division WOR-1 bacterium RIFOXYB2_FULL_36_35 TaxID=1802578 RepID=A0A1F4S5K6_UNCSA|nr:MAG: polyribonucleotide nucleotidyltransferase [candidate division WOR-1 bacterium RIFOXYA2_FULL_36_21]OGC15714.1 MAG: polyribonucleotide nucleotidyltransferase [candidate division WOR-1 bacterium RIFOXYB2_FULL_36_35]OGC21069.1 MAG: polyribonucleotide nucleotidyltransferase [candidate division WOR-1 bacterium RIFOXYA12_FULL_36_13]OGC41250.1 MAG: polyribonucleotide nucleotidyltransferase [candidate division WOR-1 bacterium RIFOXYD2_FULL_36_8]